MDLNLIIPLGILIGCLIALSWFAGSDAPYVPTKMDHIRKILKLAGVKKSKKFYELGSGDGRVVIEAAKLGANSFGIEQSWIRVLYSRWKASRLNIKNASFVHGNIFDKPLWSGAIESADTVYIFLLSKGVQKLEPLLKKNLKKGSLVITQTYHFKNWKPYRKDADFWIYKT